MSNKKIILKPLFSETCPWKAYFEDEPKKIGCGNNADEAIGSLILVNPELIGVEIKFE